MPSPNVGIESGDLTAFKVFRDGEYREVCSFINGNRRMTRSKNDTTTKKHARQYGKRRMKPSLGEDTATGSFFLDQSDPEMVFLMFSAHEKPYTFRARWQQIVDAVGTYEWEGEFFIEDYDEGTPVDGEQTLDLTFHVNEARLVKQV